MDNIEQTQPGPRPWPSYCSHKVVQAAQIRNVTVQDSGHYLVALDDFPHVQVEAKFFARGVARVGDYLVRYDDGFLSWSPRVPFEEGYARVVLDKIYADGKDPYAEGLEAHDEGKPETANPYDLHGEQADHASWNDGWAFGAEQATDDAAELGEPAA